MNTNKKEPKLIVPKTINKKRSYIDFHSFDWCIYIPFPNLEDAGMYINRSDLIDLLRANKNNPKAIQYIADMLE